MPSRIQFPLAVLIGLVGGGIIGGQCAMFLGNLEILRNGYYTKGNLYISLNITLGILAG
jgi:hypothetical protein